MPAGRATKHHSIEIWVGLGVWGRSFRPGHLAACFSVADYMGGARCVESASVFLRAPKIDFPDMLWRPDYGKGFDAGPPQVGPGSLNFCRFWRFSAVFLWLPSGFPTFPAVF